MTTIEDRIWRTLAGTSAMLFHGSRPIMTASDIVKYTNFSKIFHPNFDLPDVKLASVSSVLNRMVKGGMLLRVKGFGPKNGYGYARKFGAAERKAFKDRRY